MGCECGSARFHSCWTSRQHFADQGYAAARESAWWRSDGARSRTTHVKGLCPQILTDATYTPVETSMITVPCHQSRVVVGDLTLPGTMPEAGHTERRASPVRAEELSTSHDPVVTSPVANNHRGRIDHRSCPDRLHGWRGQRISGAEGICEPPGPHRPAYRG